MLADSEEFWPFIVYKALASSEKKNFSGYLKKILFIWLCQVLAVAHGIFDLCCGRNSLSCSMGDLVP